MYIGRLNEKIVVNDDSIVVDRFSIKPKRKQNE